MSLLPSLALDPPGAPKNEMGEPCPWPYDPLFLVGAPMGQYHCEWCGAMILAGVPHLDYGSLEEQKARDEAMAYEWVLP